MDANVSDMVSSVLSNPELMEKISGIMKGARDTGIDDALPDVVAAISGSLKNDEIPEEKAEKKPLEASKILGGVSNIDKFAGTKHVALLRSLKPFMSKSRCDMIDNILKLEQLAEVVKLTR